MMEGLLYHPIDMHQHIHVKSIMPNILVLSQSVESSERGHVPYLPLLVCSRAYICTYEYLNATAMCLSVPVLIS